MVFDKEATFEEAVITVLKQHGWDDAEGVLRYPTEQVLIDNWAKILFQNNAGIDRLNGCPLTQGEMAQVIEQIENAQDPTRTQRVHQRKDHRHHARQPRRRASPGQGGEPEDL